MPPAPAFSCCTSPPRHHRLLRCPCSACPLCCCCFYCSWSHLFWGRPPPEGLQHRWGLAQPQTCPPSTDRATRTVPCATTPVLLSYTGCCVPAHLGTLHPPPHPHPPHPIPPHPRPRKQDQACVLHAPSTMQAYWLSAALAAGALLKVHTIGRPEGSKLFTVGNAFTYFTGGSQSQRFCRVVGGGARRPGQQ